MQLHFNSTYIDVLPTDESYRYRSIMGEHTLNLYFSLSTYTDIPAGAWCEFQGEHYTLNQPAKVVKHNSRHFEYTLTMDSEGANLKNYKFRNPNDKTLKFPFTASPRYHIQILVDSLNMIDSGWQVGTTIEANEKLISYNHNNCLEALEMIAKAFETEYEIIGKTIHLHKVEYFKNNPLPLQYGKGKGFKTGVSRTTEQSRITRLYVQGGERNIDRSKYGNKELLLPKSQEYVYEGVTFISDDKGLSIAIKNAQNNGFINEQSLDLSHIYPSRKGTVSAVFEVDKAKHFYDFADISIPQALNFADLQIKGEKMVIYFESGMLSGREFEVSKYDHTKKRFQLVPKEEDGATMPNDIFKPAVGDRYSVYNMHLPAAYICDNTTKSGASWEMMKEACKYLYENRADLFTFTGDLDGIWAKKNWANVGGRLKMGGYINFSDNEFQRTPVAIRIVGLKEYVNNPYSPQIELSNKVQGHSFVSEMRKLQNQEVYFGEMNKKAISETKRSWRNALETIKQVEEAFPEYTKSIIPATVQTMMALVGNKAGQFAFVANKTNPITVPHTLYFDKNNKQINAGSGWIKHYTLGTIDIKPSHSAADYKYWYVSSFVSGRLDNKAKTYYLYIKASKTAETAQFVLSENKIGMEEVAGFYHFLYATVNSEYDGERGIAQINGFTEITGGQLVTNKISSGNGEQYILLLDNEIIIKANLRITDGNKTEIKQLVNPDLLSLESRLKQYSNDQTSNIQVGGRNLILNSKEERYKEYKGTSEDYIIYQLAGGTLEKNTKYTLTLEYKSQDLRSVDLFFINEGASQTPNKNISNTNGEWKKESFTFTTNDKSPKGYIRIDNNGSDLGNVTSKLWIRLVKLEKGNISTDWTPAPEDLEAKINEEKATREQSISTAKSATEAYARAQSELTKSQAIAEANRQAGIALTAEQQARILQLQQNLQQAKTFAEQKVNELDIGGRNLVLNSKNEMYKEYRGTSEAYIIYQIAGGQLEPNTQYTLTLEYKSQDVRSVDLFFISGSGQHKSKEQLPNTNGAWRKEIFTFTTGNNPNQRGNIRIDNNGSALGNVTSKLWTRFIKLEKGNKPTDWSPAPEDIENKVADIQTDLQVAINNARALIAVETQNRQRTDTNVSKLVNKTNFLSDTYTAGNAMATGTMILGNSLGVQAGITGVGAANNDIRFWAGSNYTDRKRAPFMVMQDGTLYATKANISGAINATSGSFTGQVNATSGKIGGFHLTNDSIIHSTDTNTPPSRIDSWKRDTRYASISSNSIIYRDNGEQNGIYRHVMIGQTVAPSTGAKGAMLRIDSIENNDTWDNIGARLEVRGARVNNIALDIVEGDVRVKGQKGYTGSFMVSTGVGGRSIQIFATNGIITNVAM
nr:MAG TPA: Neck appendage protein [Caudoviricetes sp.]DAR57099.1 MAG TPA: Neck appendage protein [Caudoviricetes sp.]